MVLSAVWYKNPPASLPHPHPSPLPTSSPLLEDLSIAKEHPLRQVLPFQMTPSRLELASSATPDMGVISLSQHYARMAQVLGPCMPSTCFFLGSEDVKSINRHPIAAGGSADIREGVHDGRKVALKCYRCYATSDVTTVVEVCCVHGPR